MTPCVRECRNSLTCSFKQESRIKRCYQHYYQGDPESVCVLFERGCLRHSRRWFGCIECGSNEEPRSQESHGLPCLLCVTSCFDEKALRILLVRVQKTNISSMARGRNVTLPEYLEKLLNEVDS